MRGKKSDKDVIEFPGNGSSGEVKGFAKRCGKPDSAPFDEEELQTLLESPNPIFAQLAKDVIRARQERDSALEVYRKEVIEHAGQIEATAQDIRSALHNQTQRLKDWYDDANKVLNEECAPDEKHCSCVPHLRQRIKDLEEELKKLGEK